MAYDHILKLLIDSSWAMTPGMLKKLDDIAMVKISGAEIDIAQIEAATGKKLENTREIIVQGKTAIIPILGIISKRMGLFTQISGGVSTETLRADIKSALDNKEIDSIFLKVDSPGGAVDGIFEFSDFIYQSRGKKPIIAYADGLMASAAYLIASAADEIVAYSTSQVGSIGIVAMHTDISEADKQAGIKRTILTSGKYKALGNAYEPLGEDAQDYKQSQLDYFYGLFIDAIARNRNVTIKKALSMADGKIFIGQQALDVGLVDKLGNFEFALQRATKRRKKMDLATLKAEHPNLVEALLMEGREQGQKTGYQEGLKAGQKTGYEEGLKTGQENERKRETDIRELTVSGFEKISEEAIKTGATVEEAMKKMILAQKAEAAARKDADINLKSAKLEQLKMEAPVPVDPVKQDKSIKGEVFSPQGSPEDQAKINWDNNPAIRAEFPVEVGGYKAYLAYFKADAKGLIKIKDK